VDAHAVVRRGDPAHELAALGREHDAALIVVGCQRHRAARTLLEGSVSLDLCRRARRPVITVPIGARRAA
jgi:nucleotide-binding universal stress UspA family protein